MVVGTRVKIQQMIPFCTLNLSRVLLNGGKRLWTKPTYHLESRLWTKPSDKPNRGTWQMILLRSRRYLLQANQGCHVGANDTASADARISIPPASRGFRIQPSFTITKRHTTQRMCENQSESSQQRYICLEPWMFSVFQSVWKTLTLLVIPGVVWCSRSR